MYKTYSSCKNAQSAFKHRIAVKEQPTKVAYKVSECVGLNVADIGFRINGFRITKLTYIRIYILLYT